MGRKDRSVALRRKSLQSGDPEANFMIAGIRAMYTGVGGVEHKCTINGHCRTQVFEFPEAYLTTGIDEITHESVYDGETVKAYITHDLKWFFEKVSVGRHYSISPSLRHEIAKTEEKVKSENRDRVPLFVVIIEENDLTEVEMTQGECCIGDEVMVKDGDKTPVLAGGRENVKFLTAWETRDGAWPTIPSNQITVNLILAGVRVAQQTSDPIRKYVDQSCLVTDDGRFVDMCRATMSARGSKSTKMDATKYQSRVEEILKVIAGIEKDISAPHIALLVNSMYSEKRNDDTYMRLYYLRLWQSMAEAGKKHLGYNGNIKVDEVVVAGRMTLRELTDYRDDIAHWWTDTIDENCLADLQNTINELVRQRYL